MPLIIHKILVKLLVKPFSWAVAQEKQNRLTRGIRAAWRAL